MNQESFRKDAFDLESLIQFFSQFEEVKKHLLTAGTEVLLAFKALLDQLLTALEKEMPAGRSRYEFLYVLQYSLGFLSSRMGSSVSQGGKNDQQRERQAKLSALTSILSVVDGEIHNLQGTEKADSLSQTDQIRLGAMMAIRNVLNREIQKLQVEEPDKPRRREQTKTTRSKASSARRVTVE